MHLYNYADDNTLAYIHKGFHFLRSGLETESLNIISWFAENFMKSIQISSRLYA